MWKRFYFRLIIVFCLFFFVGLAYGFLSFYLTKENKPSPDSEVMVEDTVTPNTKIIFNTKYLKCGDVITEERSPDAFFIGLSEKNFKDYMKDWKIERFSSKEVVLYREIDGFCPNHFIIGIYDGYVAIFKGSATGEKVLIEKTDIPVSNLREEDQLSLEKGIIVNTQEKVYEILADFGS